MSRPAQIAIVLSCVVFPGVGHVYFGHYIRGLVLLTITALPTIYFFVELSTHMIDIINIANHSTNNNFFEHFNQLMSQSLALFGRNDIIVAKLSILILWVLAVWDIHRLSKKTRTKPT